MFLPHKSAIIANVVNPNLFVDRNTGRQEKIPEGISFLLRADLGVSGDVHAHCGVLLSGYAHSDG